MRVLFAGTPGFAVPSLQALCSSTQVAGVLTAQDRCMGRGRRPASMPVSTAAERLGLKVFRPARIDSRVEEQIRDLRPDVLVSVACGRIFKPRLLDLFPCGGVNVHPSLLPLHRGVAPIPAAILAGDRETGVTVQRIAEKVDAGDVLAQERVVLSGTETASALSCRLSHLGASLLVDVLDRLAQGKVCGIAQKEDDASYCTFVRKEDGRIDWSREAVIIDRCIRAYDIWPKAYTVFKGATLSILEGGVYPKSFPDSSKPVGTILGVDDDCGILVCCGRGVLFVQRLQLQYRKPADWRSFLNGYPDLIGAVLGGVDEHTTR